MNSQNMPFRHVLADGQVGRFGRPAQAKGRQQGGPNNKRGRFGDDVCRPGQFDAQADRIARVRRRVAVGTVMHDEIERVDARQKAVIDSER